jgi:hypothetical protein
MDLHERVDPQPFEPIRGEFDDDRRPLAFDPLSNQSTRIDTETYVVQCS